MGKQFTKGLAKAILTGAAAIVMAGQAHAAVYSYGLTGGQGFTVYNVGTAASQPNTDATLTIDTTAGTGSVIGSAINAAFTGNFSAFTGGSAPTGMFDINISPSSTLSYQGNSYRVSTLHQPMLELFGTNVNLWAVWTSPGCSGCAVLGDTLKNISSSSTSGGTTTGGTTSGGTTSGGSTGGGSTGGTQVPEPGMVGLMGLGAAALVWRRRRGLNRAAA